MTTKTKETDLKIAELKQVIARLEEKRDEYTERLDIGGVKIEEARSQGKDVTAWESYWLQLLSQLEAVCDKLRDAGYQLKELQPA